MSQVNEFDITEKRLEELELIEGVERGKLITGGTGDEWLPFDPQIRPPYAATVRYLAAQMGKGSGALPHDGDGRIGVVIFHGFTPFPLPGREPAGVWGLGYEASFPNQPGIRTIDWSPVDRQHRIGGINQEVAFSISLGGGVRDGASVVATATGLPLDKFGVTASIEQGMDISLRLQLELLEVISGPTMIDNGVRWVMYRQSKTLVKHQAFVQLIDMPEHQIATGLKLAARAWVKARGWLLGRGGVLQWTSSNAPFTVPISDRRN